MGSCESTPEKTNEKTKTDEKPIVSSESTAVVTNENGKLQQAYDIASMGSEGMFVTIALVGVTVWTISYIIFHDATKPNSVIKTLGDFVKKVFPQNEKQQMAPNLSSEAAVGISSRRELMEVRKHGSEIQRQFEELLMQNDKLKEDKRKVEQECFQQRHSLRQMSISLSDVSKHNHTLHASNEGFRGLLDVYKGKEEILSRKCEEISTKLQLAEYEVNSKDYELNVVRAENQDLKDKYQVVLQELGGLASTNGSLEHENGRLNQELWWVMRCAIPRVVSRLMWSEEFVREVAKFEMATFQFGRQIGHLPGYDKSIQQQAGNALSEFRNTNWECVNELITSPELSPSFLRRVLSQNGL